MALLAYVQRDGALDDVAAAIRLRLRDTLRVATTLGYGPRFQHSTGQFHKGGPNTGALHPVRRARHGGLGIPGEPYTFGVLKRAQALGDLQSLRAHGRRAIRMSWALTDAGRWSCGRRSRHSTASP